MTTTLRGKFDMMLQTQTRLRTVLAMMLVIGASISAQAQDDVRSQFWPEVDIYVRTTYGTRLFFATAITRERSQGKLDGYVAGQFEVGLPPVVRELFTEYDNEAQPFDFLRLRVGGLYMRYLDDVSPTEEYRAMIELTPREIFYGSITFIMRNRLELRWIGGNYSTRVRSRFWIERTFFRDSDVPITPYINTEPFFDFRYGTFSRLLSQAGVAFGVTNWFAPEISLGVQQDWEPTSSTVYFVGLTTTLYF